MVSTPADARQFTTAPSSPAISGQAAGGSVNAGNHDKGAPPAAAHASDESGVDQLSATVGATHEAVAVQAQTVPRDDQFPAGAGVSHVRVVLSADLSKLTPVTDTPVDKQHPQQQAATTQLVPAQAVDTIFWSETPAGGKIIHSIVIRTAAAMLADIAASAPFRDGDGGIERLVEGGHMSDRDLADMAGIFHEDVHDVNALQPAPGAPFPLQL
ncbi:Eukaryotic/viral aspartic protease, active site [Phytophthora cinnamomi]|uniref:Eukaryotic/viral aspartic protease, active site n=1 Tax=Phytophthora cinnamomi TaxID=4785 RepID=UPI00355AB77F|nr:Eukaryotic/viral aspartic protease, active site [Phytophthora cinnamomi]